MPTLDEPTLTVSHQGSGESVFTFLSFSGEQRFSTMASFYTFQNFNSHFEAGADDLI
jgi:hypothetical protein